MAGSIGLYLYEKPDVRRDQKRNLIEQTPSGRGS